MQLRGVTGPRHGQPGVAAAHRRLDVRVDGEQVRLDFDQQLFGVGQLLRVQELKL
jgi:hypothetical protein